MPTLGKIARLATTIMHHHYHVTNRDREHVEVASVPRFWGNEHVLFDVDPVSHHARSVSCPCLLVFFQSVC